MTNPLPPRGNWFRLDTSSNCRQQTKFGANQLLFYLHKEVSRLLTGIRGSFEWVVRGGFITFMKNVSRIRESVLTVAETHKSKFYWRTMNNFLRCSSSAQCSGDYLWFIMCYRFPSFVRLPGDHRTNNRLVKILQILFEDSRVRVLHSIWVDSQSSIFQFCFLLIYH